MQFQKTPIAGAWVVRPEPRTDERGSFARLWCQDDFAARGLRADFTQCNTSFSRQRGTLRGLHYQTPPHAEVKLISCIRGRIFDVIVDLRRGSASYGHWFGIELSAGTHEMMYVPEMCAHGYLTLEDGSEVIYPVTSAYAPDAERGVRWNDPAIGIRWPEVETLILSPKDQRWPDFER